MISNKSTHIFGCMQTAEGQINLCMQSNQALHCLSSETLANIEYIYNKTQTKLHMCASLSEPMLFVFFC